MASSYKINQVIANAFNAHSSTKGTVADYASLNKALAPYYIIAPKGTIPPAVQKNGGWVQCGTCAGGGILHWIFGLSQVWANTAAGADCENWTRACGNKSISKNTGTTITSPTTTPNSTGATIVKNSQGGVTVTHGNGTKEYLIFKNGTTFSSPISH